MSLASSPLKREVNFPSYDFLEMHRQTVGRKGKATKDFPSPGTRQHGTAPNSLARLKMPTSQLQMGWTKARTSSYHDLSEPDPTDPTSERRMAFADAPKRPDAARWSKARWWLF